MTESKAKLIKTKVKKLSDCCNEIIESIDKNKFTKKYLCFVNMDFLLHDIISNFKIQCNEEKKGVKKK